MFMEVSQIVGDVRVIRIEIHGTPHSAEGIIDAPESPVEYSQVIMDFRIGPILPADLEKLREGFLVPFLPQKDVSVENPGGKILRLGLYQFLRVLFRKRIIFEDESISGSAQNISEVHPSSSRTEGRALTSSEKPLRWGGVASSYATTEK